MKNAPSCQSSINVQETYLKVDKTPASIQAQSSRAIISLQHVRINIRHSHWTTKMSQWFNHRISSGQVIMHMILYVKEWLRSDLIRQCLEELLVARRCGREWIKKLKDLIMLRRWEKILISLIWSVKWIWELVSHFSSQNWLTKRNTSNKKEMFPQNMKNSTITRNI